MITVHLVDATYELFRAYYGAPPKTDTQGREVGATVGLMRSLLALIRESRVTHIACAFDHVIESFRNQLFPGYKTGEGVDPKLLAQFELAERGAWACGCAVWPMVEFEADDALAAAAARWGKDQRVGRVVICSPDKDLSQCVVGNRVVCLNRRSGQVLDDQGVVKKFGVPPESIPDWLALVGDSADGFPGIPGWGAKTAAAILARFGKLENIPADPREWKVSVRSPEKLAETLQANRPAVLLYRVLATLRTDVPLTENLEDLQWSGVREKAFRDICRELGEEELAQSVPRWRSDD